MALLVLVVVVGLVALFLIPGSTPEMNIRWYPNGLAVLEQVPVNGTQQLILIRSESTSNPVVLFVHGGPGTKLTDIGPPPCTGNNWRSKFLTERRILAKTWWRVLPEHEWIVWRRTQESCVVAGAGPLFILSGILFCSAFAAMAIATW